MASDSPSDVPGKPRPRIDNKIPGRAKGCARVRPVQSREPLAGEERYLYGAKELRPAKVCTPGIEVPGIDRLLHAGKVHLVEALAEDVVEAALG